MKRTTIFVICSLFAFILSSAQTSTEQFETESHGSTSYTDNGVIFNILSHAGGFDIQGNFPGTGWSGTVNDNIYIDNSGSNTSGASFSIKTTSNLFKANKFWIFLSNNALMQTVTGTLTITGKLSGVIKFTQNKTTGFATGLGTTNGYTLIDLTNLNGQNYSNIVIDELQITCGGAYTYAAFDAFTWVKDSNVVLATSEEADISKKQSAVYPNPTAGPLTISTERSGNFEIYSQSGTLVKTVKAQKGENRTDISEFSNGVYILKSETSSVKIIKK